jgi:hypothetical protein
MDRVTIEKLVELTTSLKALTSKVDGMDIKLDEMRTDHAQHTSNRIAVMDTKVDRLEKIIYGLGGLVTLEGIVLLIQALNH